MRVRDLVLVVLLVTSGLAGCIGDEDARAPPASAANQTPAPASANASSTNETNTTALEETNATEPTEDDDLNPWQRGLDEAYST